MFPTLTIGKWQQIIMATEQVIAYQFMDMYMPIHAYCTSLSAGGQQRQNRFETKPVAYFTKEVEPRLSKKLKTNGHLANHGLTSLVKEVTGRRVVRACVA